MLKQLALLFFLLLLGYAVELYAIDSCSKINAPDICEWELK